MDAEDPRKSIDATMSELREKLRRTSEKLNAVSANISRMKSESSSASSTVHVTPPAEHPVHYEPRSSHSISVNDWPVHLKGLSDRLHTLSSESEAEFLRIGSSLHDFRQRAQKISEMSEYVARLINDNDVEKTVVELNWALEVIKGWLEGLEDSHSMKRMRAEKVVERTEACLVSLRKKHRISAAMARNFSAKSEEITRCINSVVQSMQYHDITRQRVEYVNERICECISILDRRTASVAGSTDAAGEAGTICRELSEALYEAEIEFDSAAKSINSNLRLVAQHAGVISAEIRTVTRGEAETEKSFLSGMGNWLSALAEILSGFQSEGAVLLCVRTNGPETGETGSRPADMGQMIVMLNEMVKSMHRINGNVLYHLSLVDDAGVTLSEDIEKMLGMFDIHNDFTRTMADVKHGLDMVVREARRVAPGQVRDGRGKENRSSRHSHEDDVELF